MTEGVTEGMRLYCLEEGPAALARIRAKILGTAALAATGSAAWAIAAERSVVRTVPAITANTAIAATAFSVCQEGVRAVRQGDSDAWNSFWAGTLAGAAMTRLAYGRGFHLLGAVMWGPLCGGLHWLNARLQPSSYAKALLASQGLLDVPQHEQLELRRQQEQQQQQQQLEQQREQEAAAAATPAAPIRYEDMPWRDKARAVEAIKQRELAQLQEWLQQQEAAAADTQPAARRRRWFGPHA